MQLSQLEQFCIIAKHEHISRAAAELFVSQPTLSLNLARLENELGVPLFDRVGRNIKLNECGRMLYTHAEVALRELEAARQEISGLVSKVNTPIVFADALFNDTFSILKDFLNTYPEMDVVHLVLTIPEILMKLKDGYLDFGIVIDAKGHDFGSEFQWRPLWDTELMALMPISHPLAGRGEISLIDLKDDEFISAISGFDSRDAFDRYCRQAGIVPHYRYTSIKPYLFNDMTRRYGSISIMSKIMYDNHSVERPDLIGLRTGLHDIIALPFVNPKCEVQFGIISYRNKLLSKAAKILEDYVAKYFVDRPGLF